jgi:hypothetical protein
VAGDAAQARTGAAVRILSPADDRIVGRPLRVAVRVAPGTRSFHAWLDEGEVTARFRRRGGRRVAAIRRLPAGLNHLHVMVPDRRGRIRWEHARFVVRGRGARLLKLAGPRTGDLRHAPHKGVARFAFRTARGASADVFLNGRRVRLRRLGRRGSYALVLSASDGLRHGRNLLRLDAYRDNGRYRMIRRRIRMPRTAPLAAAGRDIVGRHRRPVRLDARRSRGGATRARVRYRWARGEPRRAEGTGRRAARAQRAKLHVHGGPCRSRRAGLDPADLAYRSGTNWPYTDTANGRQALADIAVILNLSTTCGPGLGGVRSAYCVDNLRHSSWADMARKVDGIAYSEIQPRPPYDEAFFNAVKAQLEAEMGWLDFSHGVIDDVSGTCSTASRVSSHGSTPTTSPPPSGRTFNARCRAAGPRARCSKSS